MIVKSFSSCRKQETLPPNDVKKKAGFEQLPVPVRPMPQPNWLKSHFLIRISCRYLHEAPIVEAVRGLPVDLPGVVDKIEDPPKCVTLNVLNLDWARNVRGQEAVKLGLEERAGQGQHQAVSGHCAAVGQPKGHIGIVGVGWSAVKFCDETLHAVGALTPVRHYVRAQSALYQSTGPKSRGGPVQLSALSPNDWLCHGSNLCRYLFLLL